MTFPLHFFQVYQKLEEISHFQQEKYNYHLVRELQAYLVGFHPISDEELHSKSHILEPRIRRYLANLSSILAQLRLT